MRMRTLFLLIITGLLITNCTSTETVTTDREVQTEEEVIEERFAPEWYDKDLESATDSLSFSAYAYAIAEGEERAREQSRRTALSNLRFEIDRFAESARAELEEEQDNPFGSQQLIVDLRNSVQNLDLSDTEFEFEIREKDGFQHVFSKAQISRQLVIEKLAESISNPTLSSSLNSR